MTSFDPVDRRDIARHVRRFADSSGRSPDRELSGDDAAREIDDLGGATRASAGFDRRAAVAIALVAAVVSSGFAGRMSGPAAAPAPQATAGPAVAGATVPTASPALLLLAASTGTSAGDLVAEFTLRADRAVGTVKLTLAAGQHVLAATTVDIAAPGPFDVSIPVGSLPFTIEAMLRITPARADAAPLLAVPVRLTPSAAVVLSSIDLLPAAAHAQDRRIVVAGFASAGVADLRVAIASNQAEPVATAIVTFSGDAIGWGGVLLGGYPFAASMDAGGLRPGVPVRLVVTWVDAVSGAPSTMERVLVPPERSPDTIAPDGTDLPWTTAED